MGNNAEIKFVSENTLEEYEGEWVAVVGEEVVAHGATATQVYRAAKKTKPNREPMLGWVPHADMAFY